MSATSEESPASNPLDDLESLYAQQRRPIERPEPRLAAVPEPRLAAVSDSPFAPRAPRPEMPRPTPSAGDRLETAMSEFVRRQIKPEVVPEPADFKRDGRRRTWIAGAVGVGAAVAVASLVALLFVNLFPREKDAIQSFAAAVPPAAAPLRQADNNSKPALAQFRGMVVPNGGDQGYSHEQSERLLQQFVQWRQKAASTDKP